MPPSGSAARSADGATGSSSPSSAPSAPPATSSTSPSTRSSSKWVGLHYIPAAIGSFLVAVANNYALNRVWTFRVERGHVGAQGWRFLVVSTVSLLANLAVLHVMVTAGLGEIVAQAVAIVLVTPLNFIGNKLWSFRR